MLQSFVPRNHDPWYATDEAASWTCAATRRLAWTRKATCGTRRRSPNLCAAVLYVPHLAPVSALATGIGNEAASVCLPFLQSPSYCFAAAGVAGERPSILVTSVVVLTVVFLLILQPRR